MSLVGGKYTDIAIAGAVALGVVFMAWKAKQAGELAGRFWEGLTFDPASLGPAAEFTDAAALGIEEMIAMGYMSRDENGRTHITPEGEAYIAQKQVEEATKL